MEQKMTSVFNCRVNERWEALSKTERKAADYMVEHPKELIYASITELAEATGTSEATITRLCGKLGYRGFQALKVGVAQEVVTPQEQIHEELRGDDPADVIIDRIFASALQTLTMTQKALDSRAVEAAIDAIFHAGRLVILGCGNSGSIAMDAHHKFLRIGMNVHGYTDGHMQMIAVSSLQPGDVVLGISHSGSSRDIAEALQLAREKGATAISLTSSGVSPVSKQADIRLHTYSQETKYRTYAISSRMAELTIIDTLYTGVALRMGDRAIANFEALEKALTVKKF